MMSKPAILHTQFDQEKRVFGSIAQKIVNPDLQEERDKLDYDQKELTRLVYSHTLDFHHKCKQAFEDHPQLKNDLSYFDMSRAEQMELLMKKMNYVITNPDLKKLFQEFNLLTNFSDYLYGQIPFFLSKSMFLFTINNLGTPEQIEKWGKPASEFTIHGCYAQTELGHGSNIAGLETTATLDLNTDEWVINSPTITSAKYWPGELGIYSNFAVVCAKLIIKGDDYGPQFFFVPIRDMKTHLPFKTVEMGDIGPKVGYDSKDNGYMLFKNHRVPRENLFMKYCKVDKEGSMSIEGDPRVLYAIMMTIRMWILSAGFKWCVVPCLVAVRYSVARRQFSNVDGSAIERKLLDYQTHQFKLIPVIANWMTQVFSQFYLNNYFTEYIQSLRNGSTNFKPLKILHHFSSGLKAYITALNYDSIKTCRESCGGAGFSYLSALPYFEREYTAQVAFEGDNTVMTQQCARLIIQKTFDNSPIKHEFLQYLNDLPSLFKKLPVEYKTRNFRCLDTLEEALKIRAQFSIYQTLVLGASKVKDSMSSKKLYNEVYQQDQLIFVKNHLAYYLVWSARKYINDTGVKCPNLKKHITNIFQTFCLAELTKDLSALFECGYLRTGDNDRINKAFKDVISELRPQAVNLCESFDYDGPGFMTAIGNYHGDIYESLLNAARNTKLNKTNMVPGFKEHILPIINAKL